MPEPHFLPARHIAQPGSNHTVHRTVVESFRRAAAPTLRVEVPLEQLWVGAVHGKYGRRKVAVGGYNSKAQFVQFGTDEVSHLAPFVFHADDEPDLYRPIVVVPFIVLQGGAGARHGLLHKVAGKFWVVGDVLPFELVVHRQVVVVKGAHVGQHGLCQPLVYLLRDEPPVHGVLQGLAHLTDGERVDLSLHSGGRIQDKGYGGGRRLVHSDVGGLLQLASSLSLQTEQIEVHVSVLQRLACQVNVKRLEMDAFRGRAGSIMRRLVLIRTLSQNARRQFQAN